MRIRFGECVFDRDKRELTRAGRAVPLAPKAFVLLEILLREAPNAVAKETLHEALWPATYVTDANLANLVGDLRSTLGDDARRPHLIRTVQRFGYAFAAPMRDEPAVEQKREHPAPARLVWGERELALYEGANILGRDAGATARIDVFSVSRQHARIVLSGEEATIEDLGSKNGTLVRGVRIANTAALSDGDAVRLGTVELVFRRFLPGMTTRTARDSGKGNPGRRGRRV